MTHLTLSYNYNSEVILAFGDFTLGQGGTFPVAVCSQTLGAHGFSGGMGVTTSTPGLGRDNLGWWEPHPVFSALPPKTSGPCTPCLGQLPRLPS